MMCEAQMTKNYVERSEANYERSANDAKPMTINDAEQSEANDAKPMTINYAERSEANHARSANNAEGSEVNDVRSTNDHQLR
jgi:hypothetical protein